MLFLVDEKTSGGIIVPDSYRSFSDKGEIVAVGAGTEHKPMKLKSGTIAYRVHDWGTEIKDGNDTFYMMEQEAILAIV